jgi:hypothetical protein
LNIDVAATALFVFVAAMFAVLLRSPWWVSGAVAGVLFASARLLLPEGYAVYAFFIALPFVVISVVTAWRQWRAPGEQKVREGAETLRALSWQAFAAALYPRIRGTMVPADTFDEVFAHLKAYRASKGQ